MINHLEVSLVILVDSIKRGRKLVRKIEKLAISAGPADVLLSQNFLFIFWSIQGG